jgi:hypothetical protein
MILSDEEIRTSHTPYPVFRDSHLEANARIRELEDENRCLEMRLEDCRLDAEGVAIYIHEATNAENRADRLAAIADALEVELSESYTAPEIYDTWKCCQYNQDRADRAEAKLRELIEAAEWRDECRETAPFRPTWAGSDSSRIRCCNLDYFGNEELAKTKQAAEAAYQAALEAEREQ